jgi:hypothetical protein
MIKNSSSTRKFKAFAYHMRLVERDSGFPRLRKVSGTIKRSLTGRLQTQSLETTLQMTSGSSSKWKLGTTIAYCSTRREWFFRLAKVLKASWVLARKSIFKTMSSNLIFQNSTKTKVKIMETILIQR